MALKVVKRSDKETHILFVNNESNDCDVSIINGLRRTIIADVETAKFDVESSNGKNNPNLMFQANTGAMSNDPIAHRLSLIPIHIKSLKTHVESLDGDKFDISKLNFTLDIQNTNGPMEGSIDVVCGDFKIFYTDTPIKNDEFNILDDDTILTRLRPKPYGNGLGEKLKIIKLIPSIGSGSIHTGYTPALAVHWFGKEGINVPPSFDMEREFDTIEITNGVNGKEIFPKFIQFKIESFGFMTPDDIMCEAFTVLKKNIIHFKEHHLSHVYDTIVRRSDSAIINVDFVLEDAGHTICSIITNYMYIQNGVAYCSYKQPHPMDNKYVVRISLVENLDEQLYVNNIKQRMATVCDNVTIILDKLHATYLEQIT